MDRGQFKLRQDRRGGTVQFEILVCGVKTACEAAYLIDSNIYKVSRNDFVGQTERNDDWSSRSFDMDICKLSRNDVVGQKERKYD